MHRRSCVRKAVDSGKAPSLTPVVPKHAIGKMAKKMWSKGHDKELQFNKKKQETKRTLLDKLAEFFYCSRES